MDQLQPNREDVAAFVQVLFRHANPESYINLRAFNDVRDDQPPLFIEAVKVGAPNLIDRTIARIAETAAHPEPAVFCPPVCTFCTPNGAKASDLSEGVALSVECDERPHAAYAALVAVLGVKPTAIVASGGQWSNQATGKMEAKLHLHWRLKTPARAKEEHEQLREARVLATRLVGADATAISVVHPLRWPGSLHKKAKPRMARLKVNPDSEIELGHTLELLRAACRDPQKESGGGSSHDYSRDADGHDIRASLDKIEAALRCIPNGNLPWDEWNRMGMAIWNATGGSGYAAFDAWSRKSPKYDAKNTAARWAHYFTSPPERIGAGSIFYEADRAAPGWRAFGSRHQEPRSDRSADPLNNFIFVGDAKPSPQKMLIDAVMPLEGLPFIGGQSSAGKTFVAILIAVCAASSSPLFGHEVKERVGSVIVAAEGKGMLAARIAAAMKELGIEGDIPVAWVKQVPDFNQADGLQAFVHDLRAISEHFQTKFGVRLGLVFVDTVSASFDIKEEADNAEAARVCKTMRRIGDTIAALVVPIHHYGKNAGVGLRGASAWRANADFVLSVMADIDPQTGNVSNRQLAIAKDRDGAQGPLTAFTLKPVELGVDDAGRPWGSLVAVTGTSIDKPASDWSPKLLVFRQALLTALAEGGFEDQPFPNGPVLRVVFHDLARDEFAKITHVDSASEEKRLEAIRKQFARKLNDAQTNKLVGVRARDDGRH
jgi:AAA domain/Primase C terminal 2 (PriCT-2)